MGLTCTLAGSTIRANARIHSSAWRASASRSPVMSAITIHNINEVLDASEPTLSQNLTKLFAKLLERSQDPTFVQNYVVRRVVSFFLLPSRPTGVRLPSKTDYSERVHCLILAIPPILALLAKHAIRQGLQGPCSQS